MKDRYGLESEPIMKDAHSPGGQPFFVPPNYADLPDCPFCKYGTPVKKSGMLVCIDCGAVFQKERRGA